MAALLCAASPARAVTEVQWWHAMGNELGRVVEQLAEKFNAQQKEYRVVPVYKGQYTETMTAALFAIRTGAQPAIVQVNEIATATMMAAKGATYPVHQLMREQNEAFDPAAYLPAVSGYYTDARGNMLSFPFNASTPILYYNKDQFRVAGLDPEAPPRTWPEVEALAKKLLAAGVPCGFTSSWPSWIHVETLSALHDVAIATRQNGFAGLDTELVIANPLLVKHVTALSAWQKSRIFDYVGRAGRADPKFLCNPVGLYLTSSPPRPHLLAKAKFDVGNGHAPLLPDA